MLRTAVLDNTVCVEYHMQFYHVCYTLHLTPFYRCTQYKIILFVNFYYVLECNVYNRTVKIHFSQITSIEKRFMRTREIRVAIIMFIVRLSYYCYQNMMVISRRSIHCPFTQKTDQSLSDILEFRCIMKYYYIHVLTHPTFNALTMIDIFIANMNSARELFVLPMQI